MTTLPVMFEPKLKNWRIAQGFTLHDMAEKLGIDGVNPGMTYTRYERGQRRMPVELVEKLLQLTGGAITHEDLHQACLKWNRQNGMASVPPHDARCNELVQDTKRRGRP